MPDAGERPQLVDLLPEKSIPATLRKKIASYTLTTVPASRIADLESGGWTLQRRLKRSVIMRHDKAQDILFRDRVWAMAAKLRFPNLNKNTSISIAGLGLDVFAADDEVALIILCRSAAQPTHGTLRQEIEHIAEARAAVIREVRTQFPGRKVEFIISTTNIGISEHTAQRVRDADLIYMDEDTINYYIELGDHLGAAARYQLLGNLFSGTKIPGLDPKVPAIQGKLGGRIYYSFLIEPTRLLKLAYILHRNKANSELMPTYQRLIKRNRLNKIAQFVAGGGFFPNSIILNIETHGTRGLRFDRASQSSSESQMGILYLPQTYRAAYVIDGQHRLYGYADSHRAETDLVPVVAFVGLPRAEQVRLFMQINENQQAVPKNLRNTLNADLLYESADMREQMRALRLRIAQQLEERRMSPLRSRIVVGEEKATPTRCIAIDSIGTGLERSNFIGSVTKSGMKEPGTFWLGSSDSTLRAMIAFLELSFGYLREKLPNQWSSGRANDGFVFTNNGVESFLRVLSDIVDHLSETESITVRTHGCDGVFKAAQSYLDALIVFWQNIGPAEAGELRRLYGGAGRARYWRKLQVAVRAVHEDFDPPGLREFLSDDRRAFNTESYRMIRDIERFLKSDVRSRLEERFGARWFKDGVPEKVYQSASIRAVEKNRERDVADEVEAWDCLMLSDYLQVLQYSASNWQELFAERYTRPGEESKGSWRGKTSWMFELVRIRNENAHSYSVKEDEYNFLTHIHSWLELGSGLDTAS